MRVIAGRAKGRRLASPRGGDLRPTTDKVKEAIFSMLEAEGMRRGTAFPFPRVLDLYAGTGALGIEALSRGAEHVDFVDRDHRATAVIRENLLRTELQASADVHALRVADALSHLPGPYDLILADPPYGDGDATQVLEAVAAGPLLVEGGILLIEHARSTPLPNQIGALFLDRVRAYGGTVVSVYQLRSADPPPR